MPIGTQRHASSGNRRASLLISLLHVFSYFFLSQSLSSCIYIGESDIGMDIALKGERA